MAERIASRCADLEARVRFRPSLSWAVHDALFSFWRLPRARRRDLDLSVPRFSIRKDTSDAAIRACLDWHGFLATISAHEEASASDNSTHRIHVAWALALHAEAAFDARVVTELSETVDVRLATDETLVHGPTVRRLMTTSLPIEHGDFYMAFVVLITILEKALYDLYYHHQRDETTKKKNMILRDLLHSSVLEAALPSGLMALLKILFLPSGLNLRNLVWHGFVVPAQFPRCFACLTALLLLELPRFFGDAYSVTESSTLFQLRSFDERFLVPTELNKALRDTRDLRVLVQPTYDSSAFIPHGRERLVQRALAALLDEGDEMWFLFALLPVLEHAVRVQFVRSNTDLYGLALEDFGVAQIDQYYSTLDGFGQRDKHQVLLHAEIADHDDPMQLNALYRKMPRAAIAVCLDLFMMAAGPNVRAKLCHGEADLSDLLCHRPREERSHISMISHLVLLTWSSLCHTFDDDRPSHDAKRPRLEPRPEAVVDFELTMGSSFHPYVQLRRLADACETRLEAFESLCERWSHVRATDLDMAEGDSAADQLCKLEFFLHGETWQPTDVLLSITDKTARVREFRCLFEGASDSTPPVKKPKSFAEFLFALRTKVNGTLDQLATHNTTQHAAKEHDSTSLLQFERCLLALSDGDGLSVSACMMDILTSIDRSLASFESRLTALATLIQDGSARTNQRRAFLNNAFFLPVFYHLQRLAFGLVSHQIHHLETTAMCRAAAIDGHTRIPGLCPAARTFEQLQRKLLQFVTAFEGCTGSAEGAQKSSEKALQLALQFLESKAVRSAMT